MLRKKLLLTAAVISFMLPSAPAQAGLCVTPICIFKMILKMTPGLPVFDFTTVPVMIGQLPGMIIQKAQSEIKMFADELQRNGKVDFSKGFSLPSEFKIPKIEVPKTIPATNLSSLTSIGGPSGDVDLTDPVKIASAAESLLVNPSGDKLARDALKKKREKFFADTILEVYSEAGQLQGKLAEMPQVLEDLTAKTTEDGDENQSVRANFTARQVMSQLLGFIHEAEAARVKINGAKQISSIVPKDEPIVAAATGNAGSFAGGLNALASAVAPVIEVGNQALEELNKVAEAKKQLEAAIGTHNMIFAIYDSKAQVEKHMRTISRHEQLLQYLKQSDQCNINQLSGYFTNPAQVWYGNAGSAAPNDYGARGGISAWASQLYDAAIASASTGSSMPPGYPPATSVPTDPESFKVSDSKKSQLENQANNENTNDESAEDAEAFSRIAWDVGRNVMENLYSDQASWGNIGSNHFPLWNDQKTLYDQYWSHKYELIRKHYKCYHNKNVSASGPSVTPDQKYYKHRHNEVVTAHNNYMSQIAGATGYNGSASNSVTWSSSYYNTHFTQKYNKIKKHYKCYHNKTINLPSAPSANYGRSDVVALHNNYIADVTSNTGYAPSAAPSYQWGVGTNLPRPSDCPVDVTTIGADFSAPPNPAPLKPADKPSECPTNLASIGANLAAPNMPPGPLPPFKEYVMLDDRDVKDNNMLPYPQMPAPWQEFVAIGSGSKPYGDFSEAPAGSDDFDDFAVSMVNVDGDVKKLNITYTGGTSEFNQLYRMKSVGSLKVPVYNGAVKFCADHMSNDNLRCVSYKDNRVAKWLSLRKYESDAKPLREEAEVYLAEFKANLNKELEKAGFTPPANFDVTKPNDFNLAISRLAAYKAEQATKVENYINQLGNLSSIAEQRLAEVKKMIAALKADTDATVTLSYPTAVSPDFNAMRASGAADRVAMAQQNAAAAAVTDTVEVGCPIF